MTFLKDYKYDKVEYQIKSNNVNDFILNFYKNFKFYNNFIN